MAYKASRFRGENGELLSSEFVDIEDEFRALKKQVTDLQLVSDESGTAAESNHAGNYGWNLAKFGTVFINQVSGDLVVAPAVPVASLRPGRMYRLIVLNSTAIALAISFTADIQDLGYGAIAPGKTASFAWVVKDAGYSPTPTLVSIRDDGSTVRFGRNSRATGALSVALGSGTVASNTYTTALGNGATASGDAAHARGHNTVASGEKAISDGHDSTATASGAQAHGWSAHSTFIDAIALGKSANTNKTNQLMLGAASGSGDEIREVALMTNGLLTQCFTIADLSLLATSTTVLVPVVTGRRWVPTLVAVEIKSVTGAPGVNAVVRLGTNGTHDDLCPLYTVAGLALHQLNAPPFAATPVTVSVGTNAVSFEVQTAASGGTVSALTVDVHCFGYLI